MKDDWLEALEAPVYSLVFTDTKFHQLPVKKISYHTIIVILLEKRIPFPKATPTE